MSHYTKIEKICLRSQEYFFTKYFFLLCFFTGVKIMSEFIAKVDFYYAILLKNKYTVKYKNQNSFVLLFG